MRTGGGALTEREREKERERVLEEQRIVKMFLCGSVSVSSTVCTV